MAQKTAGGNSGALPHLDPGVNPPEVRGPARGCSKASLAFGDVARSLAFAFLFGLLGDWGRRFGEFVHVCMLKKCG